MRVTEAGHIWSVCNCCEQRIPEEEAVRLWDGNDYCENCLERKLPGLAEYARRHPRLEERAPFSWKLMAVRLLPFPLAMGVLTFFKYPEECPLNPVWLSLIAMAIYGLVFGGVCLMAALTVQSVSVEDGRLTIRGYPRKLKSRHPTDVEQFSLGDNMIWEIRKRFVTGIGAALGASPMRDKVVTILHPQHASEPFQFSFERIICRCGWTPETRRRWKAFLELTRMPKAPTSSSGAEEANDT